MVGRLGVTELRPTLQYIGKWLGLFPKVRNIFGEYLGASSGFFPIKPCYVEQFAQYMERDCREIDILAVWQHHMEDYIIARLMKRAQLCPPRTLEPYLCNSGEKPWSAALRGRRVVVIHPYAASIRSQYEKARRKIWTNDDLLPEFDLKTIRSPFPPNQPDGKTTWFSELDNMLEQASKVEYDVALIGAGAYGLSLAAGIKRQGKQAVLMGGAVQMLFGIKGRRWSARPEFLRLMNAAWVFPQAAELPPGAAQANSASYW
jgi:hypothetical protein